MFNNENIKERTYSMNSFSKAYFLCIAILHFATLGKCKNNS